MRTFVLFENGKEVERQEVVMPLLSASPMSIASSTNDVKNPCLHESVDNDQEAVEFSATQSVRHLKIFLPTTASLFMKGCL